jgi:hypothetical protein
LISFPSTFRTVSDKTCTLAIATTGENAQNKAPPNTRKMGRVLSREHFIQDPSQAVL